MPCAQTTPHGGRTQKQLIFSFLAPFFRCKNNFSIFRFFRRGDIRVQKQRLTLHPITLSAEKDWSDVVSWPIFLLEIKLERWNVGTHSMLIEQYIKNHPPAGGCISGFGGKNYLETNTPIIRSASTSLSCSIPHLHTIQNQILPSSPPPSYPR